MRLGRRVFAPSLLITVLYLAVGITMLLLGKWQLSRAAEKVALMDGASIAEARDAVPLESLFVPTTGVSCLDSDCSASNSAIEFAVIPHYSRVLLAGEWVGEWQFLWDNRIHKGVAGYEVITPIRLADGRFVLVNRGWVPVGMSREVLPDITIESRFVHVEGVLTYPSKGLLQGAALDERAGSPRVVQYLDFDLLQTALESGLEQESIELIPGLVQSLGAPKVIPTSVPATETTAESTANLASLLYPDNWQPVANGPEKHYGYAVQWFAMFIALSVLYFWLNTRVVSEWQDGS